MPDNYQNNITTLAKRLKPFIMSDAMVAAATQAVKIIVYHYDGAPAEYFDVTDTGWDLAAAACRENDTMVSPPGVFASDHVIPNYVAYLGAGTLSTKHTGKLTISAGCYLRDVQVYRTADDTNALYGLQGNASGEAYLNTVNVDITQAGNANAAGIKAGAGVLKGRGCYIRATGGGTAIAAALDNDDGGNTLIMQSELVGIAESGDGYAATNTGSGTATIHHSSLYGSTDWFDGDVYVYSVTEFDIEETPEELPDRVLYAELKFAGGTVTYTNQDKNVRVTGFAIEDETSGQPIGAKVWVKDQDGNYAYDVPVYVRAYIDVLGGQRTNFDIKRWVGTGAVYLAVDEDVNFGIDGGGTVWEWDGTVPAYGSGLGLSEYIDAFTYWTSYSYWYYKTTDYNYLFSLDADFGGESL